MVVKKNGSFQKGPFFDPAWLKAIQSTRELNRPGSPCTPPHALDRRSPIIASLQPLIISPIVDRRRNVFRMPCVSVAQDDVASAHYALR